MPRPPRGRRRHDRDLLERLWRERPQATGLEVAHAYGLATGREIGPTVALSSRPRDLPPLPIGPRDCRFDTDKARGPRPGPGPRKPSGAALRERLAALWAEHPAGPASLVALRYNQQYGANTLGPDDAAKYRPGAEGPEPAPGYDAALLRRLWREGPSSTGRGVAAAYRAATGRAVPLTTCYAHRPAEVLGRGKGWSGEARKSARAKAQARRWQDVEADAPDPDTIRERAAAIRAENTAAMQAGGPQLAQPAGHDRDVLARLWAADPMATNAVIAAAYRRATGRKVSPHAAGRHRPGHLPARNHTGNGLGRRTA